MKQKYKHVKKGGYIRICKIYTNLTVNNKNEVKIGQLIHYILLQTTVYFWFMPDLRFMI